MIPDFQVLVIGGGPSGAAAASLLAASGIQVCIAEKKQFPREVLCGEFLSAEVIQYIKQQGLLEKFLKLNPEKIKSFRLINSDGRELYSELNFNAYALKRSLFDKLLLDDAVEKGAVLFCPAEVKSIKPENGRVMAAIKEGQEDLAVSAETVIAAYGKFNTLDKKLNRSFTGKRTGVTGIKFHLNEEYFIKPPEGEIQIYLADGIYCGINPVNDNDYTVCFLSGAGRNPDSPMEHINFLRKINRKFGELFTSEFEHLLPELKFYGTSNLFFGEKEKYKEGVYFTGDASGIIAPLAGDGIGIALESAVLLSNHLIKSPNFRDPGKYINDWHKLFSPRMRTAKLIQNILLSSILRTPSLGAVSRFPAVLRYLISKTRSTK